MTDQRTAFPAMRLLDDCFDCGCFRSEHEGPNGECSTIIIEVGLERDCPCRGFVERPT